MCWVLRWGGGGAGEEGGERDRNRKKDGSERKGLQMDRGEERVRKRGVRERWQRNEKGKGRDREGGRDRDRKEGKEEEQE